MATACDSCNNGCGNGVAKTKRPDPVFKEMCAILCKVRSEACQGLFKLDSDPEKKRVQLSKIAEGRAASSPDLKRAITKKYGAGALGKVAQQRLVPFSRAIAGRVAASADAVKRYLQPIQDRLLREAKEKLGKMAVKKIASGWMKFVPVLNVLSTAYDIYDLASTGYDIYKAVDEAFSKFNKNPNIYEIFPDLAVEGKDGKLKDIYDFKFDGDRYRKEQDKLYDEAMRAEGVQNPDVKQNGTVSPSTCECDGARLPSS
jgi:hypothetical protein